MLIYMTHSEKFFFFGGGDIQKKSPLFVIFKKIDTFFVKILFFRSIKVKTYFMEHSEGGSKGGAAIFTVNLTAKMAASPFQDIPQSAP